MAAFTTALCAFPLHVDTPIYRIHPPPPDAVTPDSPAIKAMTDFTHLKVITIAPDDTIDFAIQVMVHAEVRMLIVTDERAILLGLITAHDITGERPIRVCQREQIPRDQVLVRQVMTPRTDVNIYDLRDIEHTQVRDIVLAMRDSNRQHLLVIEQEMKNQRYVLRGVFSLTQIGKQLGVDIQPGGTAQSFSRMEQALFPKQENA